MKILLRSCCIAILLFASACNREAESRIRVGMNLWPGYEPLFLARDSGAFAQTPLDLVEYRSATQVINGFRKGAIDLAAVTLDEAVRLAAEGVALEVIWVFDFSNGADQLISKAEIRSLEQLKGKRIGVEESALGAFMLQRFLEVSGLPASDLTIVSINASEHVQAMANHQIDAVITFEPEKSQILRRGGNTLFSSAQIPGEIVDVLIARPQADRQITDAQLVTFLTEYQQTLEYLKANIATHLGLLNRRLKLPPEDLLLAFQEMQIPTITEQLMFFHDEAKQQALLDQYQQALKKRGLLPRLCACDGLFNPRFVEAIR